ncbi:MAG: glycogen synthase GlgA [Armatimonadetes bacterium]|nr:glycogen synthase GlgA [Armatimonadota bacterium]
MKILIVAAEVAPFAKVGGLADVAGALPKALKALGHDVRVVMPCYKMIESNPGCVTVMEHLSVPLGYETLHGFIKKVEIEPKIPVYLIGSDRYFAKATESKKVYDMEAGAAPYVYFSRAVPEMLLHLEPRWMPDVIHANDWHTGLTPTYLATVYSDHPELGKAATAFTIHNLAYQGDFDYEILAYAGLPSGLFTLDQLEFYGRVNCMKGGIVFSDMVSTVSPTYAREIQTEEYGCRLEGLLRYTADQSRLRGILNGIDYEEYDPVTDSRIPFNFSSEDPSGKAKNKAALQEESGLPVSPRVPLFGLISRLADQKGLDLIAAIRDQLMALDMQFVLLGTGDPQYEEAFRALEAAYPDKMKANIGFNMNLAQRIYAGCDFFLMPSRFEPCGLGQMMSLRYGTVPVVRKTGGLADTITEFDPATGKGNGFIFSEYRPEALLECIQRGLYAYRNGAAWAKLVANALSCDFSWNQSAQEYLRFYREALERR